MFYTGKSIAWSLQRTVVELFFKYRLRLISRFVFINILGSVILYNSKL